MLKCLRLRNGGCGPQVTINTSIPSITSPSIPSLVQGRTCEPVLLSQSMSRSASAHKLKNLRSGSLVDHPQSIQVNLSYSFWQSERVAIGDKNENIKAGKVKCNREKVSMEPPRFILKSIHPACLSGDATCYCNRLNLNKCNEFQRKRNNLTIKGKTLQIVKIRIFCGRKQ